MRRHESYWEPPNMGKFGRGYGERRLHGGALLSKMEVPLIATQQVARRSP